MADKPQHPGVHDDIPEADTIAPARRDPPQHVPPIFSGGAEDLRVGPYDVFKVLCDAPGAKMLEARDAAGQQRLLQLAHVRAPRGEETTRQQLDYIKRIADATKAVQGDPEVRVLAHGTVERDDGSQLIYWTLPWRDGASRLGHAAAHVQSLAHLCAVAISLVERTRERHEKGRLDPLLCEDLVIIRPGAGASVAGVPLHLSPEWLSEDMIRARYAPEEMLRHEPLKSGDLWRLGLSLRGISKEIGDLPSALRRVFDALADPDPALRMSSAADASTELRKLQGQFQAAERDESPAPTGPAAFAGNENDTWPEGRIVPVNPREERERVPDLPLASMRPVLSGDSMVMKSPVSADAPTMIDMRPPASVRSKNAPEKPIEKLTKKVTTLDPDADPNDTIIDAGPPSMGKYAKATIDDVGRAKMPFGQSAMVTLHSIKLQFLDPVEMAASVDDVSTPGKRNDPATAWDRAKARADARAAGFEIQGPIGPGGTLVGLRKIGPGGSKIGPGGTVMGAKPRAQELIAKAEKMLPPAALEPEPRYDTDREHEDPANRAAPYEQPPQNYEAHAQYVDPPRFDPPRFDPPRFDPRRALPPGPSAPVRQENALVPYSPAPLDFVDDENRPSTVVGVPSLKFRGRDHGGTEVDPAQIEAVPTAKAKPASSVKQKRERSVARTAIQAVLIAAFSGGVTFAAVKLLPRLREEPRAKVTREITALGEVSLETNPKEAIVVTEDDGRILGKAPLAFLVPPNTAIPVLITAPGYEPQRLLLPARGRVNVALLPLENAAPCEVDLRVPQNVRLEAIGAEAQLGARAKIPGAALVRGDRGGAWIVLCPALGGAVSQALPEHIPGKSVEVDLLEPSTATAFLDGEMLGKVPMKKQTSSGFKIVRVELETGSVERWVPIFADTILRMPAPKK